MKKSLPYLVILFAVFIFYLPIFINLRLFLDKNNDLQEFFWPIYYFVKEQIIKNHQIPLWNNMILSGTPLLPDPQAPFFYLPNIIFLLLPINLGFIVSAFIHTFIGGIGIYFVGKKVLNLKNFAAVFCAILFVFSPKLAGYVEAGHFGLILSWAWLPWVFLSTVMVAKKPKILWSILLSISSAGLFYTHSTTFIYAMFLSGIVFILLILKNKNKVKSMYHYALGGILSFGLSAIALLPQISWIPQTNRFLLAQNPQVWPIWNSKPEFIRQILLPENTDSEKWIPLGVITLGLAFYGFIKIKKTYKLLLLILVLTVLIISANNLTPFYKILISQKWFDYLRVSTRIWFGISLTVIFLAGIGFEKIKRFRFLFCLALIEALALSWFRLNKPAPQVKYAPKEVYEFLLKDKDKFRVYCITRCLSQKEAAINHLELIDGYSTLIQKNYNSHALQLTGAYWDYYTLSIPPIGSLTETLHPNINSLGEYNAKYIISPYKVDDINLKYLVKIEDFIIYLNKKYQPRSPAPIIKYLPNTIIIDTSNYNQNFIVVSEVFNKDWKAYLDNNTEIRIQETPNRLRHIDLPQSTNELTLKYAPKFFDIGKIISLLSLITIFTLGFYSFKTRKNKK